MSENDEEILELLEGEVGEEEKSVKAESKLYSYPADFTLEVLCDKLHTKEIDVPLFQRKYVWDKAKASMLIESFMRSLPVPPVYLFATAANNLLIIDGHQRLQTIRRFFDNDWEDESGFKLELDESSDLNGKSFSELSLSDQRKLKISVMRAVVIETREGRMDNAMYDMFERLNTGGVLLKPQEIRNAIYQGRLNDVLHRLNQDRNWRRVLGKEEEDKRQRDIELILRGLALYHVGRTIVGEERRLLEKLIDDNGRLVYKPSMKAFLNDFMQIQRNPDSARAEEIERLFRSTTEAIVNQLGDKPFHLRRAMNAPTYDAVFVAFAKHLRSIPMDIRARYNRLKEEPEFRGFTYDRPTGTESVYGRIEIAERILFGR